METITLTLNEEQLVGLLIVAEDQKKYWQNLWQEGGLSVDFTILANWTNAYNQLKVYRPNVYKKTIHLTKHKYKLINKEVK